MWGMRVNPPRAGKPGDYSSVSGGDKTGRTWSWAPSWSTTANSSPRTATPEAPWKRPGPVPPSPTKVSREEVEIKELNVVEGIVSDVDESCLVDGDIFRSHKVGKSDTQRSELVEIGAIGREHLDAGVELVDDVELTFGAESQ